MKKIYSYTLATLAVVGFMMIVPNARAASFNDNSIGGAGSDCPVVMVATPSTSHSGHTCYPTSVSSAGDTSVNVIIDYHNTGTDTANNVVIRLSPQTATHTSNQTFSGSISASNAATASSTGNVSFSVPSNLTFQSVVWYKDQGGSTGMMTTPLPNGQTGAELFGNGLNLGSVSGYMDCPVTGTVRNAWCHEGRLFVNFTVSQTTNPSCSLSLTASPTNVQSGNATQLNWTSGVGCTYVTVTGTNGFSSTALNGNQSSGPLTQNTTFTINGGNGDTSAVPQTQFVTVTNNATCTVNMTADQYTVTSGGSTMLRWTSSGCNGVTVAGPQGTIGWGQSGSISTGALTNTSNNFVVQGYRADGTPVQMTVSITIPTVASCQITNFSGPGTVSSGATATLYWTTQGCTSVSISGPNVYYTTSIPSQVSSYSTVTGAIYGLNQYTMTASNGSMTAPTQQITVTTASNNYCTGTITPTQPQVSNGATTTITWWTSGCSSVSVSGPNGFISSQLSGTITTAPLWGSNSSATYTLTGYGSYGSNNLNQTTTIYSYNNLTNTSPSVTTNSATSTTNTSATLNGYISNNSSNCYYSTYSCTNGTYYFLYGTNQYNLYSQTPTQSMMTTSGAVSAYLTNLLPNTTYYFQLVGTNSYGTNYGSTLSFVTNGGGSTSFAAITSLATNVASYSVRLNGLVIAGQQYATGTVHFEYGTSQALGSQTSGQTLSSVTATNYFDTITTSPNTTYYYRIVALSGGMQYSGSIISFTTPDLNDTTPVVVTKYVSGTGGGSSYVSLSITDQFQTVAPGDAITYTVMYQNISKSTLSNAVLNVILPTGVTFKQASQGMLTTNNTVAAALGTLAPNAQGTITIMAVADANVTNGNNLVTTATLAFTAPSKAQDSAIAYVLNNVGTPVMNGVGLAGLAFFGAGFFPTTFLGWVLLLGLILLLILIARYYYHRANAQRMATQPVVHQYYGAPQAPSQQQAPQNGGYQGDHLPH
ncbi:MAG: hypothetical protein WCG55_02300 [bacterium]